MLTAVLGGLLLNGLRGPLRPEDLRALRHHSRRTIEERDRLVQDNADLRERIGRLKFDDAFLQRLIRQELGYVRRGELVYRFPTPEQPSQSSKLSRIR
jgi:hypothetical protein